MESDNAKKISYLQFACVSCIANRSLFSPDDSTFVYLLLKGLWGENVTGLLSHMAQIQLKHSVNSLLSEIIALQWSLLMMRVSGRSLPVSVRKFHFSNFFCTIGLGVFETAEFWKCSTLLAYTYYILCYLHYFHFNFRGKGNEIKKSCFYFFMHFISYIQCLFHTYKHRRSFQHIYPTQFFHHAGMTPGSNVALFFSQISRITLA